MELCYIELARTYSLYWLVKSKSMVFPCPAEESVLLLALFNHLQGLITYILDKKQRFSSSSNVMHQRKCTCAACMDYKQG